MSIHVTTLALPAADTEAALAALGRLGVAAVCLVPGLPPGKGWMQAASRLATVRLHHACLEPPGRPRWNLASGDDDLRRSAVAGASETMRRAAALGAPGYSVSPGYALAGTRDAAGRPHGAPLGAGRAHDQLCRSLDRLATLADTLGVELLVRNPAPAADALFQTEDAIAQTFERVGAPHMGLLADMGHLLLTARRRGREPEPLAATLAPLARAVVVHRNDAREDGHLAPREDGVELAMARAAGAGGKPVILDARGLGAAALAEALALLAALT